MLLGGSTSACSQALQQPIMQTFLGNPPLPNAEVKPSAADAHPSVKRLFIGMAPSGAERVSRGRSFSVTSGSSSAADRSRAVSFSSSAQHPPDKISPVGRSRSSTTSSSRRGRSGTMSVSEPALWTDATYEIGAEFRPSAAQSLRGPSRPPLAPLTAGPPPAELPQTAATFAPSGDGEQALPITGEPKPRLDPMRPPDLPPASMRRRTVQFGDLGPEVGAHGEATRHDHDHEHEHDGHGMRAASHSALSRTSRLEPVSESRSDPDLEARPSASDRGTLPTSVVRVDRMIVKCQWMPRQGLPRFYDEKASKRYDPVDDPFEGEPSVAVALFIRWMSR